MTMKKLNLSLLISLILSVVLPSLLVADSELDKRLRAFEKVAIVHAPESLGEDKMREVVIRTALNREWKVVENKDSLIVIHLVHRRFDSTLYLRYDDATIEIFSDSWRLARNGDRLRKDIPTGWIENLEKDFARNFEAAVLGL